jgi:hypothetical protein
LNKKDAERRRTAELKNNLEGYIYSTKEKVWSLQSILPFYRNKDQTFPFLLMTIFWNLKHDVGVSSKFIFILYAWVIWLRWLWNHYLIWLLLEIFFYWSFCYWIWIVSIPFPLIYCWYPYSWCQLETSEEFEKISTADERKSFIEKLDEVSLFPGFSLVFLGTWKGLSF